MRYILPLSQQSELLDRQEYLYDIFHLYFIPQKGEDGWITLIPLGNYEADVIFIIGHSAQVNSYLVKHIDSIAERIVVVTTCFPSLLKEFAQKKELYVPNILGCECRLYDGSPFGFGFPISDAELDFYNAAGDIYNRIRAGYIRL